MVKSHYGPPGWRGYLEALELQSLFLTLWNTAQPWGLCGVNLKEKCICTLFRSLRPFSLLTHIQLKLYLNSGSSANMPRCVWEEAIYRAWRHWSPASCVVRLGLLIHGDPTIPIAGQPMITVAGQPMIPITSQPMIPMPGQPMIPDHSSLTPSLYSSVYCSYYPFLTTYTQIQSITHF